MACQGERPRAASTRFSIKILQKTIDLESHGRLGRAATIRRDWKIIDFPLNSFRRGLSAVASFMLALIGLKKFRSFQKPNRIDVLEKKTRRLGVGPGVAGSVAESQESGGRLQSRFGGPEAKLGRWKTLDLSATLINSWPSSVEGFFPCLAYP